MSTTVDANEREEGRGSKRRKTRTIPTYPDKINSIDLNRPVCRVTEYRVLNPGGQR